MRCKPGELAIVISEPLKAFCNICGCRKPSGLIGHIVRVVSPVPESCWTLEDLLPVRIECCGSTFTGDVVVIADEFLQPLRGDLSSDDAMTDAQWRQANEEATA